MREQALIKVTGVDNVTFAYIFGFLNLVIGDTRHIHIMGTFTSSFSEKHAMVAKEPLMPLNVWV